ncbi:MAG TPA: GFA family protein [Sphingobium sp.]|nr:GFA family protein [Sphingobium sp.]
MTTISGGCLCGACRYVTQATPINVRACHCRLCQKAIGAAFNARVLVPLDRLTIAGAVRWYASSPALRRGFCPTCGTTLFSERASANIIGLTMGSLDDPDRVFPSEHIWLSAKQAWLTLEGGLPGYEEGPPA